MEKILRAVLVIALIVLLYLQAASLFVAPVPDSIRWYGDESWLMTEAIATVETGTLHHPHALSSTLAEPKSILYISVPWIRTLTYGVPAALAFPGVNPVDTGRAVSFVLALVLLGVVFWSVNRALQNTALALSACVILIASRSFFFASHSARYDLLTGLIVLGVALWASSSRFRNASLHKRWFWLAFGSLILAIGLPVHLYLYLAAIGIVAFVYYSAWRDPRAWASALFGIVAATGVAILLQLTMTGGVSLWSTSQHNAEIQDVTRDIPIFRLFSLSAQLAVAWKNAEVVLSEAPWLFLAIPLLAWSVIVRSQRSLFAIVALAAVIVWYFFQRPHPAYMMHMLPLVLIASINVVGRMKLRRGVAVIAMVSAALSVIWTAAATDNGSRWTHASENALAELSSQIDRSEEKPLVMVEASANKALLNDTSLRLMTTHFQFFPDRKQSIEATLRQHDVDYVIIFNSAQYGYDRNAIDPLVKTVKANADLIGTKSGTFFDIGRDYGTIVTTESPTDTLFLYRMRD